MLPEHTLALADRVDQAAALVTFRMRPAKTSGAPQPDPRDEHAVAAPSPSPCPDEQMQRGQTKPRMESPAASLLPPIARVAAPEHLRNAAVAEAIAADWAAAPPMPDGWHPDLMETALTSFSRPLPALCPGAWAPWITEPTWRALKQHAAARAAVFAELQARRRSYISRTFGAWRAASGRVTDTAAAAFCADRW